jgi:hypothetical protein
MKNYLSKTELFEAGLANENPAHELEKFIELESLVEKSFGTDALPSKAPAAESAQASGTSGDFSLPASRWIPTSAPLTRPSTDHPRAFTQALRARAQARASFSRSAIIKKNKPNP